MMTVTLSILFGVLGCLLLAGVMAVLGRAGLSRRRHRRDSSNLPPTQPASRPVSDPPVDPESMTAGCQHACGRDALVCRYGNASRGRRRRAGPVAGPAAAAPAGPSGGERHHLHND